MSTNFANELQRFRKSGGLIILIEGDEAKVYRDSFQGTPLWGCFNDALDKTLKEFDLK
jgi:hypothetical protein